LRKTIVTPLANIRCSEFVQAYPTEQRVMLKQGVDASLFPVGAPMFRNYLVAKTDECIRKCLLFLARCVPLASLPASACISVFLAHLIASARLAKVLLALFPARRTVACHFPLDRLLIVAIVFLAPVFGAS
jgi:hypothetical protein